MEIEETTETQQTHAINRPMNLLPSKTTGLSRNDLIAKNYTGGKLKLMYFLKQVEDVIELYDQINPNELKQLEEISRKHREQSLITSRAVGLALIGATFGYMKIRGLSPFIMQNYVNQIYILPLLWFGTYHALKYNDRSDNLSQEYLDRVDVYQTKALLHSQSVKYTNQLKYDFWDLI